MHVPPIWADRSSQQVRKGPPGCLLAVQCPTPWAGSWPPHRSHCLPLSGSLLWTRSFPSHPASSDASGGSRHSSQFAATSDSWLEKLLRARVSGAATVPLACHSPDKQNPALAWSGQVVELHTALQPKQAFHRSQCLTFLPRCVLPPIFNLDKPVPWRISLAPGGRRD